MKNNKRGISAVVATVLIILITVAAVTIIWAAIIPMINDQLDRGTVCLDAMSQLTILNKGYTCYRTSSNQTEVQVGAGAKDIGLVGIQVLMSRGGATQSVDVTDLALLPGINEETVLYVDFNETIAGGDADSVKIAPIVEVGNSQEKCDALSAVELNIC